MEKQIEQMACEKCLHFKSCQIAFQKSQELGLYDCTEEEYFSTTYDCDYYISKNNYCKPSDVAKEIFNWFDENAVNLNFVTGNFEVNFGRYLELKKKYTEGENE